MLEGVGVLGELDAESNDHRLRLSRLEKRIVMLPAHVVRETSAGEYSTAVGIGVNPFGKGKDSL